MILIDILSGLIRACLRLRYRIRVTGLAAIAADRCSRGTLLLPNHPALIDPVILFTELRRPLAPSFLADRDQIQQPLIRTLAPMAGVIEVPSLALHGDKARGDVEKALEACIERLNAGGTVLLYPSGHIYRTKDEHLGGNSGVERLLKACPDVRVVLVRTRGLWGSMFSRGQGGSPAFFASLGRGIRFLLLSGIFFCPRRDVTIEFREVGDLPRDGNRAELNRRLERFYNEGAWPNRYVPYTPWERGGIRELPEPEPPRMSGDLGKVPESTRAIVLAHLRDVAGVAEPKDEHSLAADLGLDSLARIELALWIEREFGHPVGTEDLLQSVGDVLLAACGNVVGAGDVPVKPPPTDWLADGRRAASLVVPEGGNLLEVFLRKARENPGAYIVADEVSGAKTYGDLLVGILALRPHISSLPGTHVGIMLPASVGAATVYFATLAAGKVPVMVNWTVGARSIRHSLELLDVRHVLTAERLVERVEGQGTRLDEIKDRFVYLESVRTRISTLDKLKAALAAKLGARGLDGVKPPDTAVVLFTSGSEALPKAVPLTHANILTNIRDVVRVFGFQAGDVLIGMLPPFHSFGINVTLAFPMCAGIRTLYTPNPTEGGRIARLIAAYRVSLLVGTPTFLNGILRAGEASMFASLRAVIAGAEKCPDHVYAKVKEIAPSLTLLEGYGITECSPVVSINDERAPKPGTIGKVLPSIQYAVIDVDTRQRVEKGRKGLLLVRGPSIFGGYLNYEGPSPWEEFDGAAWYRTGDLVSEDKDGVLTFAGRLKRFVKIGGEMISLPAVEEVLVKALGTPTDEGPVAAVEGTPAETNPELVLFTTKDIDRERANGLIREAGFSPLHFIRRVVQLDAMPVLGTGKTDYRALKARLASPDEGHSGKPLPGQG